MSDSFKNAKWDLVESNLPIPSATQSLEKNLGDSSDTGLTSLSYEYSTQEVERAYDIAYGTGSANGERGS